MISSKPKVGFAAPPPRAGIGLRPRHHQRVRDERPAITWLEVHAENFIAGGMLSEDLDDLARDYPLSLHAVGLSLGSASGINLAHADKLRELIDRYAPCLVSDHLSWCEADGAHLPDLLPLPYSEEALDVVADNVDRVQSVFGRQILIENPSVYARPINSTLSEPDFLAEICARTGCGVLLDVNNIAVSAHNLGHCVDEMLGAFLAVVPDAAIQEIHLAGHAVVKTQSGALAKIDDHGSAVSPDVWRLYARTINELGPRPTLIEWDTNIPALEVLIAEAARAEVIIGALHKSHEHDISC